MNHDTGRWISKQTEILKKLEVLSYLVPAVCLTVKFQNVKCATLIMWKAIKKRICKLCNLSKSMICTKLVATLFSNQLFNHNQNLENLWYWKYTNLNFILKIYTNFGRYTKIQPITQWKNNSYKVDYFQITLTIMYNSLKVYRIKLTIMLMIKPSWQSTS